MKEDVFVCLAVGESVGWAVVENGKEISCGRAEMDLKRDFEGYLRKELFGLRDFEPLYFTFPPEFCEETKEVVRNSISRVFDIESGVGTLEVTYRVVKLFATGSAKSGMPDIHKGLAEKYGLCPANDAEAVALALAMFAAARREKLSM